jgi:hypothetical protein
MSFWATVSGVGAVSSTENIASCVAVTEEAQMNTLRLHYSAALDLLSSSATVGDDSWTEAKREFWYLVGDAASSLEISTDAAKKEVLSTIFLSYKNLVYIVSKEPPVSLVNTEVGLLALDAMIAANTYDAPVVLYTASFAKFDGKEWLLRQLLLLNESNFSLLYSHYFKSIACTAVAFPPRLCEPRTIAFACEKTVLAYEFNRRIINIHDASSSFPKQQQASSSSSSPPQSLSHIAAAAIASTSVTSIVIESSIDHTLRTVAALPMILEEACDCGNDETVSGSIYHDDNCRGEMRTAAVIEEERLLSGPFSVAVSKQDGCSTSTVQIQHADPVRDVSAATVAVVVGNTARRSFRYRHNSNQDKQPKAVERGLMQHHHTSTTTVSSDGKRTGQLLKSLKTLHVRLFKSAIAIIYILFLSVYLVAVPHNVLLFMNVYCCRVHCVHRWTTEIMMASFPRWCSLLSWLQQIA